MSRTRRQVTHSRIRRAAAFAMLACAALLTPGVAGDTLASQATSRPAERRDVMTRVVSLMDQSEQRLSTQLDAGERTQVVQQGILDALDDAILTALMSAQPSAASPSSSQSQQDTASDPSDQKATRPGDQPGGAPAGSAVGVGTAPRTDNRTGQPWGNLPTRERDEIMQGTRDRVLEEYREQIERYYRALAERETS